jgi:hypothetical protein
VTVTDAVSRIVRHPVQTLVRRWNWKSALLSAALRGSIFFAANLASGLLTAARVLLVDAVLRIPLVGIYGAAVQTFRTVEPWWAAAAVVAVAMPLVAHIIEFVVHYEAGTPAVVASVAFSVAASVVSSWFELFAMRRGLLLVGPDAGSLAADLRRFPAIVIGRRR